MNTQYNAEGPIDRHSLFQRTSKEQIRRGIPIIVKGEGVRVFDHNGKSYLDLTSGNTRPVHVGYGRKEIAQAVYDQIVELSYFTPLQAANPPALQLADMLAEIAPKNINQFTFVCDGSEAVETALKLAKHYQFYSGHQRRHKVISRRGAYHGVTGGALRALGTVLPMRQMMEPFDSGIVFVESPYCYRCPLHLSYPACDLACARDIERIIQFEGPDQVATFIGEPIQQGFGAYRPVQEYWTIVREICDRYGIVMIADEVICGFGRTGKWFGIQHFDVQPDIITMAKGISSGYVPLGGVGCTDRIKDPIDIFQHLHTYGNHPVACASAVKNIEIIKDENLVQNSVEMGAYFVEQLKTLEGHPSFGEARGTGGLWTALDLTTDKKTKAVFPPENLNNLNRRGFEKGLILKNMGSAMEFAPPLTITKDEIDEGIKIFDQILTDEEKAMGLA